ncbi:uncharacterized protein [Spinacia oleracea]|uniref:Uncharacterized protein n=1 Tax=Spinacia oleracea TaxID=3562 RepID=A0A9R0HZG6_SPIOL|nr:uncharacterized protein LOC110778471 [Spinacia oleracea]
MLVLEEASNDKRAATTTALIATNNHQEPFDDRPSTVSHGSNNNNRGSSHPGGKGGGRGRGKNKHHGGGKSGGRGGCGRGVRPSRSRCQAGGNHNNSRVIIGHPHTYVLLHSLIPQMDGPDPITKNMDRPAATGQGILGPGPHQSYAASYHNNGYGCAPTDIEATMHNMSLNVPNDNWYMDTSATSHITSNQGPTDGITSNEM